VLQQAAEAEACTTDDRRLGTEGQQRKVKGLVGEYWAEKV